MKHQSQTNPRNHVLPSPLPPIILSNSIPINLHPKFSITHVTPHQSNTRRTSKRNATTLAQGQRKEKDGGRISHVATHTRNAREEVFDEVCCRVRDSSWDVQVGEDGEGIESMDFCRRVGSLTSVLWWAYWRWTNVLYKFVYPSFWRRKEAWCGSWLYGNSHGK